MNVTTKLWRVTVYTSSDRKHVVFSDVVEATDRKHAEEVFKAKTNGTHVGRISSIARETRDPAKYGRTGW